jgi:hypothetical protein
MKIKCMHIHYIIVLPLLVGFPLSYNYLDKEEGIFHKLPNEIVLPPVL